MDAAVRAHARCEHGQLERVEGAAHVAAGRLSDVAKRVRIDRNALFAVATFLVFDRAHDGLFNVALRERLELEQPAAAHDGGGHGDHGVFRGRADEAHDALLDGGEDGIGLRFRPAMALVEQKIGGLPVEPQPAFRVLERLAHLAHAAGDGVHAHEGRRCGMGDDRGQRGLAGARRAEEYGAGQPVGFDGAAQKPSLADDVLLSDEFVQRARPHPVGERRVVAGVLRKQILHGIKPRAGESLRRYARLLQIV